MYLVIHDDIMSNIWFHHMVSLKVIRNAGIVKSSCIPLSMLWNQYIYISTAYWFYWIQQAMYSSSLKLHAEIDSLWKFPTIHSCLHNSCFIRLERNKFHPSSFVMVWLTMHHHWFIDWYNGLVPDVYFNLWWCSSLTHIFSIWSREAICPVWSYDRVINWFWIKYRYHNLLKRLKIALRPHKMLALLYGYEIHVNANIDICY